MAKKFNINDYEALVNKSINAIEKYMPKESLSKKQAILILNWSIEQLYRHDGELSIPNLKLNSNYYEKYVGAYAKRFYTPFTKTEIYPIVGFKIIKGAAHFNMENEFHKSWFWDVEDCVILINENVSRKDSERVLSVYNKRYKGYNPYLNNNN